MIIRDRIKKHIEDEIADYIETGATFSFENENRNGTQANTIPSVTFEDLPSDAYLEWPYRYDIIVNKFLGESVSISYSAFIELLEDYRRVLGEQMASKEVIDLGIDAHVLLKGIKYEWIEANKNLTVRIILDYSHIEEY